MELRGGYFDFYIISPTVVVLIFPHPVSFRGRVANGKPSAAEEGGGQRLGTPRAPLRAPALGGMRVRQPPAPSLNFQPLHFQRTGEKINK